MSETEFSIVDDPAQSRFELQEGGKVIGFAAYVQHDGRRIFHHTVVDGAGEDVLKAERGRRGRGRCSNRTVDQSRGHVVDLDLDRAEVLGVEPVGGDQFDARLGGGVGVATGRESLLVHLHQAPAIPQVMGVQVPGTSGGEAEMAPGVVQGLAPTAQVRPGGLGRPDAARLSAVARFRGGS